MTEAFTEWTPVSRPARGGLRTEGRKRMSQSSEIVRVFGARENPAVMVVEADTDTPQSLTSTLKSQGFRVALAQSVREAEEMLHDLHDLRLPVDGLLADYRLSDGFGCRILRRFQDEFPNLPAAVMVDGEDVSIELWARSRNILLLRKPLALPALSPWLEQLPIPA